MKRILLNIFLAIFVTISLSGHAWAMGSRKKPKGFRSNVSGLNNLFSNNGHHHNHVNFGNFRNFGNNEDDSNLSEEDYFYLETESFVENLLTDDPSDPGQDESCQRLTQFIDEESSHPIPEPMTMTLMGIGLTGMMLKRRKIKYMFTEN